MTHISRYYLTLGVGLEDCTLDIYVQFYGETNEPVGEPFTMSSTSFCTTWQDVVLRIEAELQERGGVLNSALNRPSPFVDLT